jgi:lysozyme
MKQSWRGVAGCLAFAALVTATGCSYRPALSRAANSTSSGSLAALASVMPNQVGSTPPGISAHTSVASPVQVAPVQVAGAFSAPPRFGDADPVVWSGRTPASYPVHGIDVSRWQAEIDWRLAQTSGVSFAFIKATEGGDHADPGFADHWQRAAVAGVPRGAYHFFYFCTPAEVQARWFIANVPREKGALPPVLDVEWNGESRNCPGRPDALTVRAEVMTFLEIVGRHYGQRPILYTTVDFWQDNQMWLIQGAQPWLRAVTRHPSEAYPGAEWTFWQYSGSGLVPGIAGEVDLNAFAGSREAWAAWLAIHAT